MGKKEIYLDNDAEQLFSEIEGLDAGHKLESFSEVADLLAECLKAEEERLDEWRVLLVELIYILSSYFVDVRFLSGVQRKKDPFSELINHFRKLAKIPEKAGNSLLIRYRGQPTGTKMSSKLDYVVTYGTLVIDSGIAQAMFNRMGLKMSHLTGRLARAFEVFSEQGINTLYVQIPGHSVQGVQRFKDCLEIASRFNHAVKSNKPIVYEKSGKKVGVYPITDENGRADANLTLVAGLNHLRPDMMRKLVTKVDRLIKNSDSDDGERFVNIYSAMFTIPALRKKLIKPLVELNNIRWLMGDHGKKKITKDQARVTRHVAEKISGPPEKKSQVLNSVYGNDYRKIDSMDLGNRIESASELLDSVEMDSEDLEIEKEILDNVRERLDEVRDEIYEDLFVTDQDIRIRLEDGESILEKVHEKFKDMLLFFKGRSSTRKKMKSTMIHKMEFTEEDYETIAEDFDIPVDDAKDIIELLKSCFDEDGHFHRATFEKNIPEFIKYERKVFDLLWHYLKDTPYRSDRVSFLNSLQLLIAQMTKPEKALRVLLQDVCIDPHNVEYSDRNNFMLANLLVRKYNQELRLDIEITPEEVLEVREGLNQQVANLAAEIIDEDRDNFFAKIRTIHRKLLEAIDPNVSESVSMPLRYLMSLEREACIFLALVQGSTARSVLRSAVKEYGNPTSEVYTLQNDPRHIRAMLQHLKVMVRAMGRLEDEEALPLLNEVKSKEVEFFSIGKGTHHEELLRRIMERIDIARKRLRRKMRV